MNELQFSMYYTFRELTGGYKRKVTLEEGMSQSPAQIPVPAEVHPLYLALLFVRDSTRQPAGRRSKESQCLGYL